MEQARSDLPAAQRTVRDSRLPLYQQLRDEFTRLIASQQWKPGTAIPPELTLAASYEVAQGTVRRAIESLVADGMLVRHQGKGTFVRRADFTSSLFRFFRYWDSQGERRIPESQILSIESRAASSEAARELRLSKGGKTIYLTRLRLFDGLPILYEEIWLPQSQFEPLLDLAPEEFGDLLYPLYERLCGRVVANAVETLSAQASEARFAALLKLQRETPLIVIERLARGYDSSPIEWRRSRGPADRFRYRVEIR